MTLDSRERLSPDGRRLLYKKGGNLFFEDRESVEPIALTADGAAGGIDYRFLGLGRRGESAWSGDGRYVPLSKTDSRAVPKRAMLVAGDPSYPKVRYSPG